MKKLIARADIIINAPLLKVWEALTKPEIIKKYLFGTEVVTDWKVGSSIIWRGVWQGKSYEDRGMVLKYEPMKIVETTYWSSMSGLSDSEENYKIVRYELFAKENSVEIVITQDNNLTEDSRKHSEQNWRMVLDKLKKLLENKI